MLDELVARAERGSAQIDAALARVAVARATLGAAAAQARPQLGWSAAANRQGGPLVNAAGGQGSLFTLAASATYEADLFGRAAGQRQAASLDAEAEAATLRAAHLLVQAEVVRAYLALRATDAEAALARRAAEAQAAALRIAEARWRSGSLAEIDLARLRAESAGLAAEQAAMARRRAELDHALALLQGLSPAEFTLVEQEDAGSTLRAWPRVPAGIPSQVLARRPDVAATQQAWQAAQARAGVARSAGLPSLTLTGAGGHASASLVDLLQAGSRAWGLGALLALPLFDGGRREAAVQQADAQVAGRAAAHRAQVLQALREVEDHLSALRQLGLEAAAQGQAVAAAAQALRLAESRQRQGLASTLEVLDARRHELHSRRLALQADAARGQATVGLIKALGGGWGAAPVPDAEPVALQAGAGAS